jgi:transcriptional regulator with XRE-family HTH domain
MSLSIYDAAVFSKALKTARSKMHLTQENCAELLGYSISFQKDLERGRCSPSIENYYHICRTLNISADDCIFESPHKTSPEYHELLRLISKCNESSISKLISTASALIDCQKNADSTP